MCLNRDFSNRILIPTQFAIASFSDRKTATAEGRNGIETCGERTSGGTKQGTATDSIKHGRSSGSSRQSTPSSSSRSKQGTPSSSSSSKQGTSRSSSKQGTSSSCSSSKQGTSPSRNG